jgi:hypothetical protein
LQGNGYAVSTKTTAQSIVYSGVALSLARMTKPSYFPVLHVPTYDLRVTGQDLERYADLGKNIFKCVPVLQQKIRGVFYQLFAICSIFASSAVSCASNRRTPNV